MNGGGESSSGSGERGQDANGNLSNNNLGARPKVRTKNIHAGDQVVPLEKIRDDNIEDKDENSDDDFYVYRYTGHNSRVNGLEDEDEDPLEVADLPKSFYRLDVGSDSEASSLPRSVGAGQSNLSTEVAALIQSEMASMAHHHQEPHHHYQPHHQNGRESPDMDFLEMDFDPGDSSGDSSEENNEPPKNDLERPQELHLEVNNAAAAVDEFDDHFEADLPLINGGGNASAPLQSPALAANELSMTRSRSLNSPLTSATTFLDPGNTNRNKRRHSGEDGLCTASSSSSAASMSVEANMELCGARLSQREALVFGVPGSSGSNGGQNVHRALLKLRMLDHYSESASAVTLGNNGSPDSQEEAEVKKTMIWTEMEACKRQASHAGVTPCGVIAVINVLQAMEIPQTNDNVLQIVPTKVRAENAPIPEYLFSRAVAGTCHQDLIDSIGILTDGQVAGRFFSFYPARKINLSNWLANWMSKGAVPVATLNLQRGFNWRPGQTIPDAWHHQMIFGVGPNGIYLTNPLESVSEDILLDQLCSKSEILIRRSDVVSRWHPTSDLQALAEAADERWDNYNVLGQVVDVLREEHQRPVQLASPMSQNAPSGAAAQNPVQRTHVKIPAGYKSGITLYVNVNNPSYAELMSCPELPLKIF